MVPTSGIDPDLERAYAGYAQSDRKRRAWSDNPGNRAAWRELAHRVQTAAAAQLAGEAPVLDLGCGTGAWLRQLSEWVPADRIHGIDALPDRLQEARQAVPGAHLHLADGRSLPLPDATFSLVLIFTVLGDMKEQSAIDAVLAEADRVLAPGGKLLIYELRTPNPLNRSTRSIHRRNLHLPVRSQTVTLFPPLARRLGRATDRLYGPLSRVGALRSHRLWEYDKPHPARPSR